MESKFKIFQRKEHVNEAREKIRELLVINSNTTLGLM